MKKFLLSLVAFLLLTAANAQTIYYVDASKADNSGDGLSWPNAKKDLQEAINAATQDGDQIWVRAGTYFPTRSADGNDNPPDSPRDKSFYIKNKNIKLYGGFFGTETTVTSRDPALNLTILSGDIGTTDIATDNCFHVLVILGRSGACEIDGFTLEKGNANGLGSFWDASSSWEIATSSGGGLYNENGNPTINNCSFKNNLARNGAGIRNVSSNPTISYCSFSNNGAINSGGGMSLRGAPIIDHCSFTGNTAIEWGAGMRIYENNVTVSNSVFTNNAATIGGGGIENDADNTMISGCIFKGNTANDSDGGAIGNNGDNTTVVNSVFYGNMAGSRGGAVHNNGASNLTVNNCSFSGNQVSNWQGTGGGINYSSNSGGSLTNCILFNNTTPANTGDDNREEIYKGGTLASLTVSYSLIRDYSSGASNNYTSGSGIITRDPMFTSPASPAGIDGLWGTADDGLILKACSPAINAGTTTTPALPGDVFGNNRMGAYDLGAYEFQGVSTTPVLATANTIITTSQAGTTTYGECNGILATVTSTPGVGISGTTTTKVWIESTQPAQFVKRHYEIAPETNPSTSSGRITLYFTQEEFDDFNDVNSTKLPSGTSDAGGKANLRIEKWPGRSSGGAADASGLPATYTGSASTIDPADGDVVWNSVLGRWEITFNVSGFSGFFVKAVNSGALPVMLTDFEASRAEAAALLTWRTTSEVNSDYFGIERSLNGKTWENIGRVVAMKESKDLRNYTFKDFAPQNGENLYRLKMVDGDGSFAYSRIRQLTFEATQELLLFPNPAYETLNIRIAPRYIGTEARLLDVTGKIVRRIKVIQENFTIALDNEPAGIYLLQTNDGKLVKLLKQ